MVAAPPLTRNVDALSEFYRGVAAVAGLPLVIQDEPAATGVVMPVSVLCGCIEAAGARVVKLEDPPTPPKIAALLATDQGLQVFGGLGGAFALSELRAGACGTMTGFAFPEILAAVRARHGAKDAAGAAAVFDRFLPLIQFEAQQGVGLAIRKELLRRRGAIACAATRGPTRRLGDAMMAELEDVLARVGVGPAIERMEVRI
jgi:4-hydroxy-tetrahydrodipicolinate synthase